MCCIQFYNEPDANFMPGESHYHLATIYLNRKQFSKAITHYTASADLNYQIDYSIYNRGVAYLNLNKTEQAKMDFQQVIKITKDADIKRTANDAVDKPSRIKTQEKRTKCKSKRTADYQSK